MLYTITISRESFERKGRKEFALMKMKTEKMEKMKQS